MEQGKIGLVVEGGGMKCAYNAGILDAFLDAGIVGAQGKVLFYFEVQNFKKGFRIYR